MVIQSVNKIEFVAMPYPSKKFRQNPFTTFSVIRRIDRQTDRSENITSFGWGKHEHGTNQSWKTAGRKAVGVLGSHLHWVTASFDIQTARISHDHYCAEPWSLWSAPGTSLPLPSLHHAAQHRKRKIWLTITNYIAHAHAFKIVYSHITRKPSWLNGYAWHQCVYEAP